MITSSQTTALLASQTAGSHGWTPPSPDRRSSISRVRMLPMALPRTSAAHSPASTQGFQRWYRRYGNGSLPVIGGILANRPAPPSPDWPPVRPCRPASGPTPPAAGHFALAPGGGRRAPCTGPSTGAAMPTPDPTLPRPERRHDLDWLRVGAFGVLVLYHVGMYYVTWDWHVNSPRPVPALEPLMMLSAPWRLSLLFLVSGMATALLRARAQRQAGEDGRVRFLGSRSWRLLPPRLFGMAVVVVPQAYYEVVEQLPGGYDEGYLAFWARYLRGDGSFCDADGCLVLPTWNHLWFVAYLWVYTV